jgi:hypothetical protein
VACRSCASPAAPASGHLRPANQALSPLYPSSSREEVAIVEGDGVLALLELGIKSAGEPAPTGGTKIGLLRVASSTGGDEWECWGCEMAVAVPPPPPSLISNGWRWDRVI